MIKHLEYRKRVINCCNVEGSTALDIALRHPNAEEKGSIATALRSAGAKRSSSSHSRTINLAEYCALITERSFLGALFGKYPKHVKAPNPRAPRIISMSSEKRSAVLVVAVLITTATYQAILSPPGGLISLSTDSSNGTTPDGPNAAHGNPQAGPPPAPFSPENPGNFSSMAGTTQSRRSTAIAMFLMFNSVLFLTSLFTIYFLYETPDAWDPFLTPALVYFGLCYIISVIIIAPDVEMVLTVAMMFGVFGMTSFMWPSHNKIMREAILGEAENTTPKGILQ